jgi:hypothetical protein
MVEKVIAATAGCKLMHETLLCGEVPWKRIEWFSFLRKGHGHQRPGGYDQRDQ